jgi:SAM-dependent methyltransferase
MQCNLCGAGVFENVPFYYSWEDKRFQGVRCCRCRLITLSPLPTDEELTRLYAEEYFASGLHGLDRLGTDYEAWADRAHRSHRAFIRAQLLPRCPGARSVFEIGAAMGHFLAAAKEEGLDVAGIEISPAAVSRAREKFGLELSCANIEEADITGWKGRWDIVYAGDLFEHLRDPSGVLAKVRLLLEPGGLFVVRVPSTFDLLFTRLAVHGLALLRRAQRLPDNPYHLYEYTGTTLRRMLATQFGRIEIKTHATPPGRLNLKGGSTAYRAKWAFQLINYPLTVLTGRWGDRIDAFAWKA